MLFQGSAALTTVLLTAVSQSGAQGPRALAVTWLLCCCTPRQSRGLFSHTTFYLVKMPSAEERSSFRWWRALLRAAHPRCAPWKRPAARAWQRVAKRPRHAALSPSLQDERPAAPFEMLAAGGDTSTMCVSMHEDHERFLNKLDCGSNSFYLLGRVK